ncbi:hypothetical protein C8A00DRAFT_43468 [Chaetomidium leptoderma]|uniref:Protein kinase domain-containing protein n=1 Tax=Chaetomidium leptoderma TaxID=669021 RepID=A0AAN6VM34_9PEZI|nr:hypothetical protein C8A00DRAFT_43468 [Chaetomidium leptoderma]
MPARTPAATGTVTPGPYQEGKQIDLQVYQSHSPDLSPSERVTATIRKVLSMTMSPVLDVTIVTRHGPLAPIHCVLKLYDRRFGTSLRSDYGSKLVPYQANEVAFQTFVRRGMMAEFLGQLKEANETEDLLPPAPRQFLDDTPEGRAKYEAALWRESNEHFRCETEAYKRLGNLQGKSLPRILAEIRLVAVDDMSNDTPADIPPEAASYFEVRGILLERIDGYNLEDIATSPLAPADDLMKWQQIIQSAVDIVHEINRYGVIMEDCAPRNVVVDKQSQTPYIVDLAQCNFRDELAKTWHKWKWHESDDDWDPDVEYWEQVDSEDNTGAIGAVMVHRVQRETGVKLEIKYPGYTAIISGIQRRKAEAAAGTQEGAARV